METFKRTEIKDYFFDYITDNWELIRDDKSFREDLHHHAFNTDYYIIGTYQAKQWLGDRAFDVIEIIKNYEQENFGEISTDLSNPENVVNMYAYIVGEEITNKWLEKFNNIEVYYEEC